MRRLLLLALFLVSATDARTMARGGASSTIASRSNSVRPVRSSVIMLDNATYHTAPSILSVMQHLDIPVLFTGPHSY